MQMVVGALHDNREVCRGRSGLVRDPCKFRTAVHRDFTTKLLCLLSFVAIVRYITHQD
jgi:hypothetical protein